MNEPSPSQPGAAIACSASESFQAWLSQCGGSILISTYQAGKVAVVGWLGRQVSLLMRQFEKPMGLVAEGDRLALATRNQITLLANAKLLAVDYFPDRPNRYDALYLPRAVYLTGDLAVHDIAFLDDGICFVNTRFSCLCAPNAEHSFVPTWKPSFITELTPNDRCHLNGLAVRDRRPAFVTAHGASNEPGGWREGKANGGVVIDVETSEVVRAGFSMPHSPRWHDGRLWLLNSGAGELVFLDASTGQRTVVCDVPGYARGLCFVPPFALVGLSKIREKHFFGGLPIQEQSRPLQCGLTLVDLRRGAVAGMFEFTAGCEEIYDVAFLPGIHRANILNQEREETRQAFTSPEFSYWLRPTAPPPS